MGIGGAGVASGGLWLRCPLPARGHRLAPARHPPPPDQSINLAAELARVDGLNKRVALLDFDGQCNLTAMLVPAPGPAGGGDEYGDDPQALPVEDDGEPAILQASRG